MSNSILDEALGIKEPRKTFDELAEGELGLENAMVAVEPHLPVDVEDPPRTEPDTWSDYEYSRKVARDNLKQAQIVLEAAIEFTNSSPSARSFEVLGGLITKVSDCGEKLLDLQKKMRDLEKATGGKPKGEGGDTNVFVMGDPTDVLARIAELKEDQVIDGQAERTES